MALGLILFPAVAGARDGNPAAGNANAASAVSNKPADAPVAASNAATPAKPEASSLEIELQQLRDLLEAQAKQIQIQNEQLKAQQQRMQAMEERLKAGNEPGKNAAAPAELNSTPAALNGGESTLAGNATLVNGGAPTPTPAAQKPSTDDGPGSIRYKGIGITPGGFIAAETVYRQRATSSDINTPFNSIPYPGNALSKVPENSFTARQSRLSLLSESKFDNVKLTGYWEADWLGTGVTSNNRQSNSYVFRQRVLYGQAAFDNGWIVTGGQQWSLATETRKGITNRSEVLPMTIDSQYQVGFTWERQYGFRIVKDFGGKFALGFAVEGPQATIGGRGFSLVTTTTVGTASVATSGNTFMNAPGAGGGLYNFSDTSGYPINKAPDIIFKATADPGFGHYELFGIISTFSNRVYPCGVVGTNANDTAPPATPTTIPCPIDGSTTPSSLGAYNDRRTGGGVGANLRVPLFTKKVEFALQGAGGDGLGRYGSAQLADLTFRPNGTAALIRTAHGLGELEFHVNPKLDIYAYFGGEYAWRDAYQGYDSISVTKTPAIPATATTVAIPATTTTTFKLNQIGGYASPFANNSGCNTENPPTNQLTPSGGGTCAGDTRVIMEGTLGFWHKLYQGPRGGLRWGLQYSYFTRNGWSGNNVTGASVSPKAVDNMIWTSFRYYLP
jgi:hypothetical protein